MESKPPQTIRELQKLVIKQREHYGDAMARIAQLCATEGRPDLHDAVMRHRELLGLGEYKPFTLNGSENIDVEDSTAVSDAIVEVLRASGYGLRPRDIKNRIGRIPDSVWYAARTHLIESGAIRIRGTGPDATYSYVEPSRRAG